MKQIDTNGLQLCNMQGNIFRDSVENANCSSPIFIRRFMYSDFAKMMDNPGFTYGATEYSEAYAAIEGEFGASSYGKKKYNKDELFWIGYIYRYWSCTYELASTNIYKICPATELCDLYFPYHSLDPKQAIERILEAKGIKEDIDLISKGIRILRRLMKS